MIFLGGLREVRTMANSLNTTKEVLRWGRVKDVFVASIVILLFEEC